MSVNSHSADRVSPRKTPRQERSRAMVERILDAAARLFDERGYRGTTTNHVAEAAGVSVGSLYQYFPNKDALLTALAERHLDDAEPAIRALADELVEQAPSPGQLATLLVEAARAANPDALHRLLRDAPHNAAVEERFAAFRAEMAERLAGVLVTMGHPPERADVRARLVFDVIDTLVHGETMQEPQGPAETERLVALVLDPSR